MNGLISLVQSRKFWVTMIPAIVMFANQAGYTQVSYEIVWALVVSCGTLVAAIAHEDAAEKSSLSSFELVEDFDFLKDEEDTKE